MDLPNAMSASEVTDKLRLNELHGKKVLWFVFHFLLTNPVHSQWCVLHLSDFLLSDLAQSVICFTFDYLLSYPVHSQRFVAFNFMLSKSSTQSMRNMKTNNTNSISCQKHNDILGIVNCFECMRKVVLTWTFETFSFCSIWKQSEETDNDIHIFKSCFSSFLLLFHLFVLISCNSVIDTRIQRRIKSEISRKTE